jgi:transposase InsO family protein
LLGDGYYVHPNVRRLALLSGGYRPVFSSSGWLVDEVTYNHGVSAGCFIVASLATQATSRKPQAASRKPQGSVIVHSDQGSQFSSGDWQSFLKANHLVGSMSRRGNCHDNAVAESFFQLLKRERIKREIYSTREAARLDVFNYIVMFYNPKRQHSTSDNLSLVEYERRYFKILTGV